ncbi:hypothetical protein [Moorena sp. SIO3H5]|uniref:hypothetical protein n=1 Tax=Moorena sp. SIO3H5 TaxID=2607834 RepID=UPI0013B74E39|nr:hypothetical protein [Moorena sp. SIO3H5]NEO70698.1 hypothetical protein [Moorena sp. SIO3H5]
MIIYLYSASDTSDVNRIFSLLPLASCLLPLACSLLPAPCSLKPRTKVNHPIQTAIVSWQMY